MKVTGETFSFHHKRKRAEEARYQKYQNFQVKGLLPDRTLESFMLKSTDGAIPKLQENSLQAYFNKLFPSFIGRIFQVKGQSKKVILLFSYSVLFIFNNNRISRKIKMNKKIKNKKIRRCKFKLNNKMIGIAIKKEREQFI